ncbi:unnamed protein product [Nippostrongylus brasiliensis]|uniref:Integrase core domain containing protein n=1 Tax=Nippostrongylus brasiliensis TaxID=27835 RepID=A0A0N4YPT6_NIPBR|nr:unnamed protein product [Nippostrongylus brasiliensis]
MSLGRSRRRTLRRRPGATTNSGGRGRWIDVSRSIITVRPIHQAMDWNDPFLESSTDPPRTECQKASNNAVLHEIKDLMGRFTKFETEIEERLKAVEEKQEVLPKVLAAVEEPSGEEDILCIEDDIVLQQTEEPTTEKEAKSPDSYDDRRILDEPAAANRSLK